MIIERWFWSTLVLFVSTQRRLLVKQVSDDQQVEN
jgi:hypothetical protein